MAKKLIAIIVLGLTAFAPTANAGETITVFAASSLTDAYTQIGKHFERKNPQVKVIFSFQASSTLISQISNGAPADILVSAEPFYGGKNYVRNRVVVAIPKSSSLARISDLDKVKWIQCAHEVPCGLTADAALRYESVKSQPVSLEPKVTSVVAKLLAGEVDAAITFRTDVIANNTRLNSIEFSNRDAATTIYQIAQLRKNRSTNALMNFLQSRATLRYLQSKGFDLR